MCTWITEKSISLLFTVLGIYNFDLIVACIIIVLCDLQVFFHALAFVSFHVCLAFKVILTFSTMCVEVVEVSYFYDQNSSKGQKKSKWFFQVVLSSKKGTNEFYFTIMTPQIDLFLFVFWKKLKTPKRLFEIIWPLTLSVEFVSNSEVILKRKVKKHHSATSKGQ